MMYALLGNLQGVVTEEKLQHPFVYVRASVYREVLGPPRVEVIIVKNEGVVPNVYDLPVKVFNGEIVGTWGDK
jgi:hypothetical protein